MRPSGDLAEIVALSVGEPAPPLDLPTLPGGTFSLGDARGQPLLVSFLRHAG